MGDWMNQLTQWKIKLWKKSLFWVTYWHDLICKHILSKSKTRGQVVHISLQLKCSINVYPFFSSIHRIQFHNEFLSLFFAILLISFSPFWIWALNFSFPKGPFRFWIDYSQLIWDCSEIWGDRFKLWKCPPRAAAISFCIICKLCKCALFHCPIH